MATTHRPRAWIDLVSPSHPFFFDALAQSLDNSFTFTTTVRDKTETVDLTAASSLEYSTLGRDFDNTLLRKLGIPLRTFQLMLQAPACDVSLSSRNAMCILASKARGIPSIHFTDNDITAHIDGLRFEELYNRLEAQATYNIVPDAFDTKELTKWGANPDSIYTYDGYKEDIYIADFEPDPTFTDQLPFEEYLVVRPEALTAAYVDAEQSLVPELLERMVDRGYNVVYLPRGRGDEHHAAQYPAERVYTPQTALDGLQLAWHSQCVLTGSGTMAREAACMQKSAVSFFPSIPLSVDQQMIDEERILHSRKPDEIMEYITAAQSDSSVSSLESSKSVKTNVANLLKTL